MLADSISLDQAKTGGVTAFLPVDTALLRPGPSRSFDLYKKINGSMVLLCAKDYALAKRVLTEIKGADSDRDAVLYVPAEHGRELSGYAENVLREVMQDRKLGLERRSQILHSSALAIMSDILANPTTSRIVRRGIGLANVTVNFMLEEPKALQSMSALFSKDYYTYTHSVHVCVLGVALYKYLITPKVEILRRVGLGLLLHDTGKSIVDQSILNKRTRLTQVEFEHMQSHPQLGWEVLHSQGTNDDLIKQVVLHHHEKMDGTGYPTGAKAKDLPPAARIAATVDVYDALTTDRPYRKAMSHDEAMALIYDKMIPHHLDAEYLAAFDKVCRHLPKDAADPADFDAA